MFHWLQHDIVDRGRLPLLCCLVAFVLTFLVTRSFVRFIHRRAADGRPARWWQPRNVHIGSVHIHHVAFGVVLVMISGLTLVTLSVDGREPEFTIAASIFGVGAALVLDEYALILHLSDVYWEEDGRTSVDAVFAAVAVAGLLIMGLHPLIFFLPVRQGANWVVLQTTLIAGLVLTLPLAVVVLLKGQGLDRVAWHVRCRAVGRRRSPAVASARSVGPVALHPPPGKDAPCATAGTDMAPPGGADQAVAAIRDRRDATDARRARGRRPARPGRAPRTTAGENRAHSDQRLGLVGLGCGGAVLLRHRIHRGWAHHRVDLDRGGRRRRPRILRSIHGIRSRAGRQLGAHPCAAQAAAARLQLWRSRQQIRLDLEEFLRIDGTDSIELWAWVGPTTM